MSTRMLVTGVLLVSVLGTGGAALTALALMSADAPTSSRAEGDRSDISGGAGQYGNTESAGLAESPGKLSVQGPAGPDGAAGRDGNDGRDGAAGPAGPAGRDGSNGLNGRDGSNGRDGATGAAGAVGLTGLQGIGGWAGLPGAQGTAGAAGANGLVGATGAQGTPGAQGPVGPAGPPGAQATSNVSHAQLVDLQEGALKDGDRTVLLSETGPLMVPTSGVFRVTLTVRIASKTGYDDVALQIGTIATEKGDISFFASERSGSQAAGYYWMHATTVVFLEESEQLAGHLTIIKTGDVRTDRGWLIIEKLTP